MEITRDHLLNMVDHSIPHYLDWIDIPAQEYDVMRDFFDPYCIMKPIYNYQDEQTWKLCIVEALVKDILPQFPATESMNDLKFPQLWSVGNAIYFRVFFRK